MKQRWVLQGRVLDSKNWHDLRTYKSRKAIRLNRIRLQAKRFHIQGEYRAVLKTI